MGAAYVDETVASRLWNNSSPVGAALHHGAADGALRVDGVAGAVREWDQGNEPYGTVYASWSDQPGLPLTIYVFARGAEADRHQIEVAAARIDPLVPAIATALATATAEPLRGRRLLVIVAIVLAGIACLLAFVGTYAIVMHTVRQRLREAAIRLALGATTANVRASFMRTGLVPAGAGLIVGIAGLKPAESLVSAQLFHVRPGDPLVLAIAVAALAIAAGLAVLLPTRRATHVNPTVLLRDD
jgi:putative ABC transport system permease protein